MYLPVFTDNEPVLVTIPSFFWTASSTSFVGDRFLYTLEGLIPKATSCDVNLLVMYVSVIN